MLKIDLLRHGETTLSHTLRGSTDDDLTEVGWSQMQQTIDQSLQASTHQQLQWDVVFSSSLKRCHLFAHHIAQQLKLELIIDSNLQEMHFGDWEGISTQVIYENESELLANFWQNPLYLRRPMQKNCRNFSREFSLALKKSNSRC